VSSRLPGPLPLEAAPGHDIRPQRMAELVADQLRNRILTGDLEDGDLLPKEEELRELYPVSKPSFREAMRILEAQGLITIRRGNIGGSVVHRPTAKNVAYTLAMVLATREAAMDDVAQALRECEPVCVALCAERSDRRRKVLPTLRRIQRDSLRNVGDLVVATTMSRQFHEALVQSCGNQSLIIMVGALEAVWSSHETNWASRVNDSLAVPLDERRAAFDVHEEIIELIDAGDSDGARELSTNHLRVAQGYPTLDEDGRVDHSRLRS
jgi:GntR family transcriptional regulator, transcriptional repressor for pyruvate dehydrogenase complex